MPLPACLLRGRQIQPRTRTFAVLLSQHVTAPRRWAHVGVVPTPHYEAAIQNIRNIGIIAHVDAGKTTTTERMLYYSGQTRHLGNVDHGDTVTDFLPMERARGITIQSAATSFNWPRPEDCKPGVEPKTINLIDTPGHQDFQYEVLRCMPVLDGAVCVMDSVKGVEAHTERVWSAAQQFKIPRLIFVNKLDRDGASFRKSVMDIATRLKAWPLVCQIPWWVGDNFTGVIDVIKGVGYKWTSGGTRKDFNKDALKSALEIENPSLIPEMERAREQLIERLCEVDDEIAMAFADHGADLSEETIKLSIRRAISDGNGIVAPVFAGASLRNLGVEPLLDAVVDYLPNPQERPPIEVKSSVGTRQLEQLIAEEARKLKAKGAAISVASVFKVISDPHRGMLSFVRVYHGTLERRGNMWNSTQQVAEKPMVMMQILANKHNDIPHLKVGGIGALAGLKAARTGDTLIISPEKSNYTVLKSIQVRPAVIPPAVTFISIEPFSVMHEQMLEKALIDLSREDPSLRWSKNEKTAQYILSGMGLLHLEVAIDALKRHKIDALFGTIQVDYKEVITSQTPPEHFTIDRAVAGKPGKAACSATIAPLDPDQPTESWRERAARLGYPDMEHPETLYHVRIEREGNTIDINIIYPLNDPKNFDIDVVATSLANGAAVCLYRGPRKGYPMQATHVELVLDCTTDYFGAASPAHYQQASYHAVRNALRTAHTSAQQIALLEPVMKVEIVCPESVAAQVRHDLSSRHSGHVLETEDLNEGGSGGSAGGAAGSAGGGGGAEIDLAEVYAPPDPYESVTSLRAGKKNGTRMLKLKARVPLIEMLNYDAHLRAMTEGRHTIQMELDTFERVTGSREKQL